MKCLLIIVALLTPVLLYADAKSDWARSLRDRRATLKIDLPTFVPDNVGVLVLTPDRGQCYSYGGLADRTPEQLLVKVKADNAAGKSIRVWGWETGAPEPAELITVKAGSKVTIAEIQLLDQDLMVWLWDEFAKQQRTLVRHQAAAPSTGFIIQFPQKFSKGFSERQQIETMIASVLGW
jgi:hypothetical protein